MSTFENDQFRWRETYFVLFDSAKRPKLDDVVKRLAALDNHFVLTNSSGDSQGRLESITILSPDDYAAMDVCYLTGDEVRDQTLELVKDLKQGDLRGEELKKAKKITEFDARFDVLHFEQIAGLDEDEADEMFDPSSLLVVLEALVEITGGVAIDPQSGAPL
jgi:hypothetical protein